MAGPPGAGQPVTRRSLSPSGAPVRSSPPPSEFSRSARQFWRDLVSLLLGHSLAPGRRNVPGASGPTGSMEAASAAQSSRRDSAVGVRAEIKVVLVVVPAQLREKLHCLEVVVAIGQPERQAVLAHLADHYAFNVGVEPAENRRILQTLA